MSLAALEPYVASRRDFPEDWGGGWLSNNARDLCVILATFVLTPEEFKDFIKAVCLAGPAGRITNTRTVERVLDEMFPDINEECKRA